MEVVAQLLNEVTDFNQKDYSESKQNIKSLLEKAEAINLQFKEVNEQNKGSFNIFNIIRHGHEEVDLHSKFLFNLLDPGASHQLGATFLELFIKQEFENWDFKCEGATVHKEYSNIDIFIKNKNKAIIVENKIHAGDISKQLQRYSEIAEGEGCDRENIKIVYLTLDGKEPSDHSRGDLAKKDITLLAYNKKSVVENNSPNVDETGDNATKIKVVENITLDKKEDTIYDLLDTDVKIDAYLDICGSYNYVVEKSLKKFSESLVEELKKSPQEINFDLKTIKEFHFAAINLNFCPVVSVTTDKFKFDLGLNKNSKTIRYFFDSGEHSVYSKEFVNKLGLKKSEMKNYYEYHSTSLVEPDIIKNNTGKVIEDFKKVIKDYLKL